MSAIMVSALTSVKNRENVNERDKRRAYMDPKRQAKILQSAQSCQSCSTTDTPEWRKGPNGPRTLCNACGLVYAKMARVSGGGLSRKSHPTLAQMTIARAMANPTSAQSATLSINSPQTSGSADLPSPAERVTIAMEQTLTLSETQEPGASTTDITVLTTAVSPQPLDEAPGHYTETSDQIEVDPDIPVQAGGEAWKPSRSDSASPEPRDKSSISFIIS
ncbi:hypothetical protein IWQ60_002436 [Tieghemiomyces parasiticus]|uniref:GATA-type domain-containing protein n=1 Tax=Tieghemiomyces parasiticus TaxID=78921 RepID=A0A9W8AEU6_9FUNG|nr:hypothetical protein IWQ60_002436 [Tieghemiomyces parasiticus]